MEGSVNAVNNQCTVITSPQYSYNGAHVGTYYGPGQPLTPDAVKRYEAASGEKVDYVLDFMAFSGGLNFPTAMADYMAGRDGTLLVRLEPWNSGTPVNGTANLADPYPLKEIAEAGKNNSKIGKDIYKKLINFAQGAIAFSKKHNGKAPIWVSFAHEMNMELVNKNRYPWAGRPKEYKEAYRRVVDIIRQEFIKAGAVQIVNWVWNPNIDFPGIQEYYPETEDDRKAGRTYVHWVALDGYNSEDTIRANWKPFPMLFSTGLAQIATFGKPIMIAEYGCDTVDQSDRDKYIADETKRKPNFMIGAHYYILQDGRIKAASSFNEVKMEAGSEKRYGLTSPEQEKISRLLFTPDKMGKYYTETIQAKTVSCQTVDSLLQTKEQITPGKMISDRKLVLDQSLRYVIIPAAEGALAYERASGKIKIDAWLNQKEEMSSLVDGLLNAWYIYRELGKPANPAGQECLYTKEIPGTKKTKEVSCLPELKNLIADINKEEKKRSDGGNFNFLPSGTPVIPYLNDAVNFALGVLKVKYPAETTSQDNINLHEKIMKKRVLVHLASIAATLAGEVSEKDNRQVLASLLETYLPALLKNNAIKDRTLRAAFSGLLLGLGGQSQLKAEDRAWVLRLEERESELGEKDTTRMLQLVNTYFQLPVVLPLVKKLRAEQPLVKADQFSLLEVVDQLFVNPVRESEKLLHDGNIFALMDKIGQNPELTAGHLASLTKLRADLLARQAMPDSAEPGKYITAAQETELYKLMDAYLPHEGARSKRPIIEPVLTNQFDRSLYKRRSQLMTGKNLAVRAFIAKDFLKDKLSPEKIKGLFDEAQKILEQVDTFQDQADKAETQQWIAKILMVKAGLEKDKDKEFATLGEAIKLIKGIKVDLRHLQLHTQEVERMQAEALARQGFIRKEQKLPYEAYFAEAKKILGNVMRWGEEYKQLVGDHEPLWSQQVIALAKLWYGKVRLVELGEEKQGTRLATVQSQQKELESVQSLLGTAIDGLGSEPALQADVFRSLGECQVRLAYARKDQGDTDEEVLKLLNPAINYLKQAAENGIDLTKVEAYAWLTKATLLATDYEKSRDDELTKLAAAGQYIDKALALQPGVPELKGRSLSDLYATRGELLLKQGDFKTAVIWFERAKNTYGQNYDAKLNLADVLTWQKEYQQAAKLYDQVLADEAGFDPSKSRFSDELAFDRARISRYELAMRRDRNYGGAEAYLTKFIAKEAPASSLRKRAVGALIELYSNRNEWHERIATFYEKELKGQPILHDLAFSRETLRKVAEAYGWLKQFAAGRDVLKTLPAGYWREATRLTDAELEMHYKKVKLGVPVDSDADPQLGAAVIAAAKTVLATRTDDPMLVLKAINTLAETAGSEKLFMGMIALGSLLLGENYTPKSEAEKEALAVLTAGLRQLPGGKLPLGGNYLAAVFQNFSPKALAAARLQVGRIYADGLMWQKNYPAAIAQLEKLAQAGADPTLTEREKRLIPADAKMKLGEIYRYDLKEVNAAEFPGPLADYFNRSLKNYDLALASLNGKVSWVNTLEAELAQADLTDPEATAAVLARYADQAARLEDDELSTLANLYIGRGETRRYAQGKKSGQTTKDNATQEDIRNYNEARKNYLLAQLFIGRMPGELIDEKHLLAAKLHNGYGKVGEVLGIQKTALAGEFEQAHDAFESYLSAGNLPPEGGLGDEIEIGLASYGKFVHPSTESGSASYTDRYRRAEQRFGFHLEQPLGKYVTLGLADNLDLGHNALLNSVLGNVRLTPFDNETFGSLNINLSKRLYGNYPDKSQDGIFSLLPQPEWEGGFSYWQKNVTADGFFSTANSARSWLNTYHASLYANGAGLWQEKWYAQGLRAGLIGDKFPYYVENSGYAEKYTLKFALDYQVDLKELFNWMGLPHSFPYSFLTAKPFVRLPIYQYAPLDKPYDQLPHNYDVNQYAPTGSYEFGLNLQANLGKWGILNGGVSYLWNRDYSTSAWDYKQWQARAGWTIALPDPFAAKK